MHTRKYLLKNAKESRRTNDELDLDGHDGAIEIEAVPDEVPKEERQKHCVVRLYECEAWADISEVDVFSGDLTGAEGSKEWKTCDKNPGHEKFIPAQEFLLEHLPQEYRTPEILALVQAEAELTVRLRVQHTSAARPDGYPFCNFRGRDVSHTGTGVVTGVGDGSYYAFGDEDEDSDDEEEDCVDEVDDRDEETRRLEFEAAEQESYKPAFTQEDCPCHECEDARYHLAKKEQMEEDRKVGETERREGAQSDITDGEAGEKSGETNKLNHSSSQDSVHAIDPLNTTKEPQERPCWSVTVETALHVVYDTKEARSTVMDVFYDTNSASKRSLSLYGFCVTHRYEEEDRCIIKCATHNEELVRRLSAAETRRYSLNKALGKPNQAVYEQSQINTENASFSPQTFRLAIVIGHPHGRSKTISVGYWIQRIKIPKSKESALTYYLYDTPTCKGNSGGAVMTFGKVEDQRAAIVMLNHHHRSSSSTPGLNMSSPSFEYSSEYFTLMKKS
ncbi:hypothetical protein ElyMa_000957600 [Elysia marginata]|uniref:Uncharacterized protein n=1 Tax=Elysia marginata TaxID=1093978 RepID=A0AAV4HE54_9GAST|nr:hypothetical protein ElyMa_000957600 [Elysia marginata]